MFGNKFLLWLFLLLVLASSCYNFFVEVKSTHIANKIVFLTAMIEQQKQETSQLPQSLEEIKPRVVKYLSEHSDFNNNYLSTPWTTKSVDIFSTGTGYPFWYQKRSNGQGYYLYCSYGTRAERELPEAELSRYLNRKLWHNGLYVVSNGTAYSGRGLDDAKNINAENMQSRMKMIDYKGHTISD